MSNVTMKSTKQEIMDALKEAQAELARRGSVIADPTQMNRKQEEDECIQDAARDVNGNVFSDEMNEKYTNLANAIALMEKRLTEQYEVEAALLNLVTVTNAAKNLQFQLDADYASRKEAMEEELQGIKRSNAEALESLRQEYVDKRNAEELKHAREKEEYEYTRDRERKLEEDEYNDKVAEANKTLESLKAEAATLDAEIESRQQEINDMRTKIEAFPKELEEKYQEGYTEGEKAAGKEYGYKKAMADKEHEYQIREKDSQINHLENTVDAQALKIESLESKLDAAYSQIQALAAKTVESNGSIKVIGGSTDNGNKR